MRLNPTALIGAPRSLTRITRDPYAAHWPESELQRLMADLH